MHMNDSPDKVNILFLAANPRNLKNLDLTAEVKAIDKALRESEYRDHFELHDHWKVNPDEIPGLLLRHKPDIVHFSCHGSKSGELYFENKYSQSEPVRDMNRELDLDIFTSKEDFPKGSVLANLLETFQESVKCVVLNACHSEVVARAIHEYIPCVVGMSRAVDDISAIAFAKGFYQGLGYGKDGETAFRIGKLLIDLKKLKGANIPQVLGNYSFDAKIKTLPVSNFETIDSRSLALWGHEVNLSDAEQEYLKNVEEDHGKVFILGQGNFRPVEDIYTALHILEKPTAFQRFAPDGLHELFLERGQFHKDKERRDGLGLVNEGRHLFILGKPGAGKTTFLKHVAIKAARYKLDPETTKPKIPVFISLHQHSLSERKLLESVELELAACRFPDTGLFVESFLRSGRAIVLFDGLDEVKSGNKALLPAPRPLRTARATFTASRSSLIKA